MRVFRKWWFWLSLAMVALVGGALLVVFVTGFGPYDLPAQSRQLEATLERSRELGLPMTQADLKPTEPIPNSENAALVVAPIADKLSSDHVDITWLDTPEGIAKAEAFLSRYTEDLVVLDEGLRRRYYFLDRDYDQGATLQFTEAAGINDITKTLVIRSRLFARRGEFDAALRDLESIRLLVGLLLQEPVLISYLVANAQDLIALGLALDIATQFQDDPAALVQLRQSLAETKPEYNLLETLRGEFYIGLATCRNMDRYGGIRSIQAMAEGGYTTTPSGPVVREGVPGGLYARASLNYYATEFNEFYSMMKESDLSTHGWSEHQRAGFEFSGNTLSATFTNVLMPIFPGLYAAAARLQARERATATMIHALEYRARTGAFPADLSDYGHDAEDPFLPGQKLRFEFTDSSARIWSVGDDLTDDGGDPKDDVVARFPSR